MSEDLAIGVDLGGTNFRIAIADSGGNILETIEKGANFTNRYSVSSQIIEDSRTLCKKTGFSASALEGIGIASTGVMDENMDTLINPANIPFERVPIVDPIKEELDLPTYLLNDCTAGVLGEKVFGEGSERGLENIVYVNIGTGIGGGAIVDNHLLFGKGGNAGEIGHMTVDPRRKLRCNCGGWDHWEAYCSGKGIPNFVRIEMDDKGREKRQESILFEKTENLENITAKKFYEAVRAGDDIALELAERINRINLFCFGNLVDVYDPSLITLGGSVALKNADEVVAPIRDNIDEYTKNISPEIISTPLKGDIGIYGAIARVFEEGNFI